MFLCACVSRAALNGTQQPAPRTHQRRAERKDVGLVEAARVAVEQLGRQVAVVRLFCVRRQVE